MRPRTVSIATENSRMPRACVIVLDAVGAGELPDAHEYGDEVVQHSGQLLEGCRRADLPELEQLGLGNIGDLEGCPPLEHAPAYGAGGSSERSKGKGHDDRSLGVDGHRHAGGDADLFLRSSFGCDPRSSRTGRAAA